VVPPPPPPSIVVSPAVVVVVTVVGVAARVCPVVVCTVVPTPEEEEEEEEPGLEGNPKTNPSGFELAVPPELIAELSQSHEPAGAAVTTVVPATVVPELARQVEEKQSSMSNMFPLAGLNSIHASIS